MRTLCLYIIIFLCYESMAGLTISDKQVKETLTRLDQELAQRDTYINSRQTQIDSLRSLSADTTTAKASQLISIMRLADEYSAFNTDSALYYYAIGQTIASAESLDSLKTIFKLQHATYLPLVGFISDAINEYERIAIDSIPEGLTELYYDAGRQMYSYIASFYHSYPNEYATWSNKSLQSQLLLLSLLDKNSPKYKLNQGEYYFLNHEYAKARAILIDLIASIPEDNNIYARASHKLAEIARARGESNEFIYYLTLSAIADIKSATLEVMSLQELGVLLYELEDIDRAHNYLSIALDNAVRCNAMMRMVQSSSAMPIIESAHKVELETWQKHIYRFIGGLALLLIILAILILFLRRKMQHMKILQQHLETANHTKEVYISQFMSLCSIYMDKLHQLNKLVNRKISSGNVDDLYKITKSGKFVEEQSKEFYEIFDNAFLHIYPTFVESVNKLLKPEEQIILNDGKRLNSDLRLLAFMRLGIKEVSRIAQILNYSVNTVYAYRNKLKNRAINGETFEADIMKISSIS